MKQLYTIILLIAASLVLSWAIPAAIRVAIFTVFPASGSNDCQVSEADTLCLQDASHVTCAAGNRWNAVARWLFPVYLTFTNRHTEYLQPAFRIQFGWSLVISHLTFFGYLFTVGRRDAKRKPAVRFVNAFVIILFGIPGLLASLLFK
jgi:hypothetical protein